MNMTTPIAIVVELKGPTPMPGMRSENAGRHVPRDLMNAEAGQGAPPGFTRANYPFR